MAIADIATPADIDRLVAAFYQKVLDDPMIGFFFTDLAGNALDAGFQFTYQTGNVEDHVAATLVASTPFTGATVGTNASITLVMSEPIDPLSITTSTVGLFDDTTLKQLPAAVSLGADAITLTVVPNAALPMRHDLHVTIFKLKDLFGNPSNLITLGFHTGFTPDATPPKVVATSLPDGLNPAPLNATLAALIVLPYLTFFVATLHIADYVSYRDVFHAGETLAPISPKAAREA